MFKISKTTLIISFVLVAAIGLAYFEVSQKNPRVSDSSDTRIPFEEVEDDASDSTVASTEVEDSTNETLTDAMIDDGPSDEEVAESERCKVADAPANWKQEILIAGTYRYSICYPGDWLLERRQLTVPGNEEDARSYVLQSTTYRKNGIGEAEIGIWLTERKTGSDKLSSTVSTGSALLADMMKDGRAIQFKEGGIITLQPPLNIDALNAVPQDTLQTAAGVEAHILRGRINGSRWKGNDLAHPIDRENEVAIINIEGEYQLEIYDDGQLHRNDNIFDSIVKSFSKGE